MSSSEDVLDFSLLQEMLVDYPPFEEKTTVEETSPLYDTDSNTLSPKIKGEEPEPHSRSSNPTQQRQRKQQLHGRRRRHPHVPKTPLVMVYRLCPSCRKALCKDRQRVRLSGESTFIRFKLCPGCASENLVLNPVL